MNTLWLVIRLSYGEMTYIEEWDTADKCQAALERLERLNNSVDNFRCMVEFSTGAEPMSSMRPLMLGTPPTNKQP
jgi:hypothetical protein